MERLQKNWCLLTLLSSVNVSKFFSIFSTMSTKRVKPLLPDIINGDLAGFINCWFMGENTRLAYNTIAHFDVELKPGRACPDGRLV